MGTHNSLAPFYGTILQSVISDIAERYTVCHTELVNDRKEICERLETEGLSFLTKTLPLFGKAVDKALSSGTALQIPGFHKRRNSVIPKFLGWLLEHVFASTGYQLQGACPLALAAIRQIAFVLYKLELPYDEKTIDKVISSFVETDKSLSGFVIDGGEPVIKKARALTSRVFSCFDHRDLRPRHGPGAVATGEKPHQKHNFSRLYNAIERVYPFTEYFMYNCSHVADHLHWLQSLEVLEAGTAKAVLVPKDSRGPRLISCEPLEYQWIQQGLGRAISAHLESHRLTAGHVNFTDQRINRRLALESSYSNEWVTLDMKDASDRVSLQLVTELFSGTQLLEALLATRSVATRLPNGEVVQLNKFAPMGSCLCFPVEAFVFYALAVSAISVYNQVPMRKALESVYVYGDDIIVRRKDYPAVLQHLPRFGLMFNTDKCCVGDSFRESCGCDAFKGIDVTPTRVKTTWSLVKEGTGRVLVSYVCYANSMYEKGLHATAQFIKREVEALYGPLPYISISEALALDEMRLLLWGANPIVDRIVPCGAIGWVDGLGSYDSLLDMSIKHKSKPDKTGLHSVHGISRVHGLKYRYNAKLHRPEVMSYIVQPLYYRGRDGGWQEMLRRRFAPASRTVPGTYALPRRTVLKRGWRTYTA